MTQEEGIILERHEGRLLLLEREMKELRSVQKEIRAMNESLVVLTNELRHTNEHMKSHGKRLGELERTSRTSARWPSTRTWSNPAARQKKAELCRLCFFFINKK